MSVNKVTFTINSRQYTVVAEESVEYIERLCSHINEKVENVLRGGQNIMGERPVVLAALNVCDEYYKALEENEVLNAKIETLSERNQTLKKTANQLTDELENVTSGQISIDEAAMQAEVKEAKDKLDAANNHVKFLEGQVKNLENKLKELEERDKKREKDFLDLIDKQ